MMKNLQSKDTLNIIFFWTILLLAFVLRLYFLSLAKCIEIDGSEYARLAENLLKGNGYIGLDGAPHLGLSPLYPIMIAGLALIINNIELSGRIISLILGTATLFPVYLLVKRVFNQKTALLSILITAVYPPMVLSSRAVLSEASYTFMFMWGMYFMYRIFEEPKIKWAALLGLTLSLAFLIRPEAYLFLGLAVCIIIILAAMKRITVKKTAIYIIIIALIYVACALPHALFIHRQTGHFSLEGKSSVGLLYIVNVGKGQSYHQIMYGLNSNLEPYGLLINKGWTISEKISLWKIIKENPRSLIRCWARNFVQMRKYVFNRVFKMITWVVIIIGLILSVRNRRELLGLLYFLIPCFLIFGIYVSYQHQFRFYIPSAPLVLIALSFSICKISDRLPKILKIGKNGFASGLVMVILTTAVLLLSFPIYKNSYTYTEAYNLEAARAGIYIREAIGPGMKMMACHPPAAYYAGAVFIATPYADWDTVKAYAFQQKVDLFCVDSDSILSREPIAKRLLENEYISEDMKLLKKFKNETGHEFRIYKLIY